MDYTKFVDKLNLAGKVVGATRVSAPTAPPKVKEGCTLAALKRAMAGESLWVTTDNAHCAGGNAGFGLCDGLPNIPGGFGHFLSYGKGEGFPPGERIKSTPELGEAMLLSQPQDVMDGYDAVKVESYRPAETYDIVTMLVNPDQLATLVHIFNFEKVDYDNVIAPMTSGCASVFRIPFAEQKKGSKARAVIGNIDVFSRPHFPADSFFFTVPGAEFEKMLVNADQSVITAPIWKAVGKRLQESD